MTEFYQVLPSEDYEISGYGVAYSIVNEPQDILPKSGVPVDSWEPIFYKLKEGSYADYLADNIGARLCSPKLKDVIEKNLSGCDIIQWLKAYIVDTQNNQIEYSILHFPVNFSIINNKESVMVGEVVVKPVLKLNAVRDHNILKECIPKIYGGRFFVSKHLMQNIIKEDITGIGFSPVGVR